MSFRDLGIVVIARDEGERLVRCLESVHGQGALVVYADSGSRDGSPERARAMGCEVVELDPVRPMNAARGRNAGFARLLELRPDLEYALFLDGDCRLVPGFLEAAHAALERESRLAAVCGRRRELHPEASPYNRVVDLEWNTPVGESTTCGGDVLVRARALAEIGGYDERMNQGEDPEMAYRLRRRGWRLLRIANDMTLHDVALLRFSAWWRRHRRGGLAYAHGALLHGHEPERYQVKTCASILGWGLVLPALALLGAPFTAGASLALLGAHGLLWWRVRAWRRRLGDDARTAGLYAAFIALGKTAEALGVVQGLVSLRGGGPARTVEYKDYQRRSAA